MFPLLIAAALAQTPAEAPSPRAALATTALVTCLASEPAPLAATPLDGRLLLEVRVKRGKIALVTAIDAEATGKALAPCFERELVGVTWDVKRGRFELPVPFDAVPAPAPERTPEPATVEE